MREAVYQSRSDPDAAFEKVSFRAPKDRPFYDRLFDSKQVFIVIEIDASAPSQKRGILHHSNRFPGRTTARVTEPAPLLIVLRDKLLREAPQDVLRKQRDVIEFRHIDSSAVNESDLSKNPMVVRYVSVCVHEELLQTTLLKFLEIASRLYVTQFAVLFSAG